MNLNHNKNQLQYMSEEDFDNSADFSVSRVSRKELRSRKENEEGRDIHSMKDGKRYRKY